MIELQEAFKSGWTAWGALAAGFWLAAWLVGLFWGRIILPFTSRTRTDLDNRLAMAAMRPVKHLIFTIGAFQSLAQLGGRPEIAGFFATPYLLGLLKSWAVLAFTWLMALLIEEIGRWYLGRLNTTAAVPLDVQLMPLLTRFSRAVLFFVAATVILGFYDVKITALLGVAGVASLAIALAAQDTLANMIGGLTIMIDRPIRIGDRVQLQDGLLGDVYEIGLRTTKILTFDKTLLIIPNAELAKQVVINHSYPDPIVTTRQKFGVAYGTDLDRAKRVLLEEITSHPQVLKEPAPNVYFMDFGESSLDLLLYYAVESFTDRFSVQDQINMKIKRRCEAEGIEIPFPQRTVHLKGDKESGPGR